MPNIIRIPVDNPAELLNAGAYGAGALIRIQSGAAQAGPFANLTGTGSTPTIALVAGTYSYTGYDPAGTSATWYQTRYENSGGTLLSDWQAAFQVGTSTAGFLCSLADVKQRILATTVVETDTVDDEILLDFIADVSDSIATMTGRTLLPDPLSGTTTYLFDGFDALERGLLLPIPRGIRSVTLLEVAPYTGGTFTTTPSTDYFLQPSPQQRDPGWPATELWMTNIPSSNNPFPYFADGWQNIRITGSFGWPAIPPNVSAIAEAAVVRAWRAKQTGQADIVGTSEFGARILRFISPEERERLDRYTIKQVELV